ncbi:ExbD/TolR family protein [Rhodosalinus sp.]|uniref:ExbD/TolR family protein n=1 Tax=Rhodosalinus sp. TaxID=2047741 RepID=UPI0035676121
MKLHRRSARDAPEPIIALIDVVFFLLVFFLLVGRFDATAPFEVLPAETGAGADMPGGGITVSVARDGRLALESVPIERSALLASIESQLDAAPDTLVRLNAHRAAELRHVLPLLSRIEALGAAHVALVVTPEAAP